jgi:hypothetical protein
MNAIYLRRRRKLLLKTGDGRQPDKIVAAMQKNLESLGFVMSVALMDCVKTLTDEKLGVFYKSLIKDLQQMVGAHRAFAPMYPNFPEQVREMPEGQLYLNAIIHYLTNKLPLLAKRERAALSESTPLQVLDIGTREEFEEIFTRLAAAKTSLSATDKKDLAWFVSQYREDIVLLIPEDMPSKENFAFVGAALLTHAGSSAWDVLNDRVKTATDVLRLAVAMSGGDVSLAEPVKFQRFNRHQRRTLLSWLERCGNPVEDMLRWKKRWIRLGERLHPGDYADEFPKTYAAFKALRNDERVTTFNSRIEALFENRHTDDALALLSSRPGDLARRLDHLLRTSHDTTPVLETFRRLAEKVSTPVLLQMHSHFLQRDAPPELRIFFPKGELGLVQAVNCDLPALRAGTSGAVVEICEQALAERFRKLSPLGRCWLDERLRKFMAPMAQRSASKALRTLTRGSRLPLPDTRVLRFFIWWKNGGSRTDIDLSASLFDENHRYKDVLSYYNLKNFGGCHSGDVVDAPQGAAEFIDVELDALLKHGVRYIVMSLSSFTQQPYCDLPECFAGWMARQSSGSGEIFEPRTVFDKVDIASNTRICLPAAFDLVAREVIWADLALTHHPSFRNNVHTNLSRISLMLKSLTTLMKPNLHTLFSLHAQARGTIVTNKHEAEAVFGMDEGITPYDVDRIRAEFL